MRALSDVARRTARLLTGAAAALVLAACSEDLESGAACPALCPDEALATRDTVLEPIVLDTTLTGYPGLGLEGVLPLIARGDTVDTRAIIRFDALPSSFTPVGGSATPYAELSSATLRVAVDSAGTVMNGPVTVEAYDVGAADVDTTPAAITALFRADRLLGTARFETRAELGDTLRLALSPATVLSRTQGGSGLRVGLVVRSPSSAQISLNSFEGSEGAGARLILRTPADTAAQAVPPTSSPRSSGEAGGPELRDFLAVVRGPAPPTAPLLAVGGVYGRRVLMQFAMPPSILDSATVVRATLELTQSPNRAAADRVSPVSAYVQPVTASIALADTLPSGALREPGRIASFLCAPAEGTVICPTTPALALDAQFRLVPIIRAPIDSGAVRIEVGSLIRIWQLPGTSAASRAIVLRVPLTARFGFDAQQGGELLLFSKEAAASVRPRLRLTYVTRSSYALP